MLCGAGGEGCRDAEKKERKERDRKSATPGIYIFSLQGTCSALQAARQTFNVGTAGTKAGGRFPEDRPLTEATCYFTNAKEALGVGDKTGRKQVGFPKTDLREAIHRSTTAKETLNVGDKTGRKQVSRWVIS